MLYHLINDIIYLVISVRQKFKYNLSPIAIFKKGHYLCVIRFTIDLHPCWFLATYPYSSKRSPGNFVIY